MSHDARAVAARIAGEWAAYEQSFARITRRARARFEAREWKEAQADSVRRLALYREVLQRAVAGTRDGLRYGGDSAVRWPAVKDAFAACVAGTRTRELAETFFNSVTRRTQEVVGVAPDLEFVDPAAPPPEHDPAAGVTEVVRRRGSLRDLVGDVLRRHQWPGWEDLGRDSIRAGRALQAKLDVDALEGMEIARPAFFRNKGAYVVGRALLGERTVPVVFAVLNPGRPALDAVLVGHDDVTAVFSFTRSYFFVDTEDPKALVGFLRALLPRKPVGELYSAIGMNRHGKTELYRALLRQVAASQDAFEIAPGARGMVMVVFTLPSYDVVFKVIRDRFEPPKSSSRADVLQKYQLVFEHDRAGRLIDAQEFENLVFDRTRFSEALLHELARHAAGSVEIGPREVVVRHAYSERRLTPLDLYLRRADAEAARLAVLDYGQAIKDLARTNIFPGDLLLKNFGVTRLRRVVFYDYDELSLVTACRFRDLPQARDDDEETAREPWFHVDEHDVFPEELLGFLGLRPPLREVFVEAHGDLLRPAFWRDVQERHRAGQVLDLFPYPQDRRLMPV